MLATLYLDGILVGLPLQVLPDMAAAMSPESSHQQLAQVLFGKKAYKRGRRDGVHLSVIAVAHAMLQMLPFKDLSVYRPSFFDEPSRASVRAHDNAINQWYRWMQETKESAWCLGPELRVPASGARVLVFACDEGTSGFSAWCFLAGVAKLRTLFHRDVPHRLTNAFVNSLRSVPYVFQMAADILLLHKWRRAPFGGGRFWKQAKETLLLLVQHVRENHPLLELYKEAIARDMGRPLEDFDEPGCLKACIKDVLRVPVGQKAFAHPNYVCIVVLLWPRCSRRTDVA